MKRLVDANAASFGVKQPGRYDRTEHEKIHIALLQEALRGVKGLTTRKTTTLKQLKSRHGH